MNNLNSAFDALAMIPGWDPDLVKIEELSGGLSNRVFRVRRYDKEGVLRLVTETAAVFKTELAVETAILAEASLAGVGPAVIFSDPDAGVVLTEYLPGRVWTDQDLASDAKIESLAILLRNVHALPKCGKTIDMHEQASAYEKYLQEQRVSHSFALQCAKVVKSIPQTENPVCCHNDIVAGNVVEQAGLRLIDWEYACDNNPMFDLASVICFHDLSERSGEILLDAYSGSVDGPLRDSLAEQKKVFDAIQWLWLASRQLTQPSRVQKRRLEVLQRRIA